MRKLILRSGLPVGDMVMLTAAIRDLHHCYPGKYLTDVRTRCPELWEQSPHLTPLSENDPEAEQIDCEYPLINHCNQLPYHCLHGFIKFLNERLHIAIELTKSKGDIHLSDQEKSWYSQVQELTGVETPFWIIAAGGKYDVTVKWWETCRYQEVVDRLRGRIQFVQVGLCGHHHPKLEGVIDLRGQTTLRELIRLVYHSQGVLCPITSLMHLAAAVETKRSRWPHRPCVVIAGGREPAHWEAYPGHQFIHLNGALACCAKGGCWKDRTVPLRDGDKRDKPGRLCVDVVDGLPRCMNMITPEEVIRRIETYYTGGILKALSPVQRRAAEQGIAATAKNDFDQLRLNIHRAGQACDRFIGTIPVHPGQYEGRGIVICGGGLCYFTNAWVCINMLRRLGCRLPIQLWHLGTKEMDARMTSLLSALGVVCVDACQVRRKFPVRILSGWALKPYALLHCSFREILLLDADNVPVVDPEFLFNTPEFRASGAVFWPDYAHRNNTKKRAIWRSCGLRKPREPEFETGQLVVDKQRCWRSLRLCLWFNENSDFYYQYVHGDKETFHLAFRKINQPYALVPTPIHTLAGTMCQHDFQGRRIFQHRNTDKWDFLLSNLRVKDFWFEKECREYVMQLRRGWNGRPGPTSSGALVFPCLKAKLKTFQLEAVMISCAERDQLRQRTLQNLERTDWGKLPVHIQIDESDGKDHEQRQTACALLALKAALARTADYVLFLEDDLEFNRHIRHNLEQWTPLRARTATLAGLYNPQLRIIACDKASHSRIVAPKSVFGSQALVISRRALKFIVAHWNRVQGMQDIKISRLAGRLGQPILYHAPSLVQHVGRTSVSGAPFHQANDFDKDWKIARQL